MSDLTDEQRRDLAWAIASEGCIHTGGIDYDTITGCRDCQRITDSATPVVARMLAEARAEALQDAANAWTQGQWSDVMLPAPTPPAVPVIAYSNSVGDWLRARANLEEQR